VSAWFTLRFEGDAVVLLDQRRLPREEIYLRCSDVETLAQAIESLAVRGAPAIGCAAAFGVALAANTASARDLAALRSELAGAAERLARTRPTAVNLFWALARMRTALDAACAAHGADVAQVRARLAAEAQAIHDEDVASCRAMGRHGLALVHEGARILTHCNAEALATAD